MINLKFYWNLPAANELIVNIVGIQMLPQLLTVSSQHVHLIKKKSAIRAVQRDCHWGLKNSGNSHWSHEPIMEWGTG